MAVRANSAPAPAWKWLLRQPSGFHVATTVFMGTAAHLLEDHEVEPTADKEANIRRHLELHKLFDALAAG